MASGTIKAVVPKSDIANNLTTNDSTKVLSAAQGYALSNQIANFGTLNFEIATNQESSASNININVHITRFALVMVIRRSTTANEEDGMILYKFYQNTLTKIANVNGNGINSASYNSSTHVLTLNMNPYINVVVMGY